MMPTIEALQILFMTMNLLLDGVLNAVVVQQHVLQVII
jgi:hypothetical protein